MDSRNGSSSLDKNPWGAGHGTSLCLRLGVWTASVHEKLTRIMTADAETSLSNPESQQQKNLNLSVLKGFEQIYGSVSQFWWQAMMVLKQGRHRIHQFLCSEDAMRHRAIDKQKVSATDFTIFGPNALTRKVVLVCSFSVRNSDIDKWTNRIETPYWE